MQNPLRTITSASRALANAIAPLVTQQLSLSPTIDIPALNLSPPQDLHSYIENLPLTSDVADAVTQVFNAAAVVGKERLSLQFENSCRQLLATPSSSRVLPLPILFERLQQIYQSAYHRHYSTSIEELISYISTRLIPSASGYCSARVHQSADTKRTVFNHKYVPLFEKYFEDNPFPSHADKSMLATQSNMTYRQIDVWFQNRRSRAKRDGLPPKKLTCRQGSKILPELLGKQLADNIVLENQCVQSPVSDVSESMVGSGEEDFSLSAPRYSYDPTLPDILNTASPPHAFPSPYPPTCYNPFPVKDGNHTFPPPVWMRHPTMLRQQQPIVEINELIEAFSRLNVRDGPRKQSGKAGPQKPTAIKRIRTFSSPVDRSVATMSITTKPLPAPIPAFIRPTVAKSLFPPASVTCLPSPPLALSIYHHQSRTPLPEVPPRRRKIAPLPRRAPAGTNIARRTQSPEALESPTLQPVSHSPVSRQSSFQSDYSSQSRLTSDSSSASSVVVTPETMATALPNCQTIPDDFSLDGFLNNQPSSGRLSPVHGIRLGFPLPDDPHITMNKQPIKFAFTPIMA